MTSGASRDWHGISVEYMVRELEEVGQITGADPDVPIVDLAVDSLRLLEWVYVLEDATGIPIEEQYAGLESLDHLTIRTLQVHLAAQLVAEGR